jgi:hypothetical protein
VIRWIAWAIVALLKPKALLVAENMCLRQQLVVSGVGSDGPDWVVPSALLDSG